MKKDETGSNKSEIWNSTLTYQIYKKDLNWKYNKSQFEKKKKNPHF